MRGPHTIPLAQIMAVWANAEIRGYKAKAAALGVSIGTMHRWARALDLPNRPTMKQKRKALDADHVRQVWADTQLVTMADKAAALGCGEKALNDRRRALGLPDLARGPKPRLDKALLRRLWDAGVSSSEIAPALGVSRDVVIYTAKRMGLARRCVAYRPLKTLSEVMQGALQAKLREAARIEAAALLNAEMVDRIQPDPVDEGALRRMWAAGLTVADIAKHFKRHPATIKAEMVRLDLPRRGAGWRPAQSLDQYVQEAA